MGTCSGCRARFRGGFGGGDGDTGVLADVGVVFVGSVGVVAALGGDVVLDLVVVADGFDVCWVRCLAMGCVSLCSCLSRCAHVLFAALSVPYLTAAMTHAGGVATTTCAATARSPKTVVSLANILPMDVVWYVVRRFQACRWQ